MARLQNKTVLVEWAMLELKWNKHKGNKLSSSFSLNWFQKRQADKVKTNIEQQNK